MPNRVSLSKDLSLQHLVSVAHKALEKGGSVLKLDTKPTLKDAVAAYESRTRSMELASHKVKQVSRMTLENVKSGYLTPNQDYGGMIHHDYAHHLSNRIVPEYELIHFPE